MVPNFALSLSFEGIALLRRMGDRWALIKDVSFDSGDLEAAVLTLRNRAEELDPDGAKVALIIPNEQIRYLDIPDLGGDDTAQEVAVRTALDGATPYAVDDLVFDHVAQGGHIFVAAVARETLDEAEEFASQNGFEPVSHSAIAPEGQFDGAVYFGASSGWSGDSPTRFDQAVEIVAADQAALTPLPAQDQAQASLDSEQGARQDASRKDPVADETPGEQAQNTPASQPLDASATLDEDTPRQGAFDLEPEVEPARLAAEDAKDTAPIPDEAVEAAPLIDKQEPSSHEGQSTAEPAIDLAIAPETAHEAAHETGAEQDVETTSPLATELENGGAALDRADPVTATPPKPVAQGDEGEENAQEPVAQTAPEQDPNQSPEQSPDTKDQAAPAAVSFSTIRASRDGSDLPSAPQDKPLSVEDGLSAQVKPRFTPVGIVPTEEAAPAPAAQPRLTAKAPVTPVAKPPAKSNKQAAEQAETHTPKAPSVMPAAAQESPAAKPDATPDTPEVKVAAPALARLAALRARAETAVAQPVAAPKPSREIGAESDAGTAKPAPIPAAKPVKASKPKGRGALAGLAALRSAAPAQDPGQEAGQDAADPLKDASTAAAPLTDEGGKAGQSALGRIAALRSASAKPDKADPKLATAAAATLSKMDERDRMTVFGARRQSKIGGKPRFLGLFLTAGLLLFMAGVAAWASVFLSDGIAGLFRSTPEETTAVALAPDITPEIVPAVATGSLQPADDAKEEEADDVQLAALETGIAEDPDLLSDAPQPRAVPIVPQTLTPEEAAAKYAATGIWQRAPFAPHEPPVDGVDDIYVASIDPKVQEQDAIALPDPLNLAQEPVLALQRNPPPAGQIFDMDERGLVRATPEGALSPEGLRVFAGLPPVVPPQRTALAAPVEPEAAPLLNEALSKLRPRLRPNNLIEEKERAQFQGISRKELAAFRPVMRPKTAQEEAIDKEPEAEATDQAVTRSLAPVGRPRNMAAIVKRADRDADSKPRETVQTAAIAPRTVTPAAPTARGVAASATVRNAINLKKVNLIGVYGTPANRRALVRLPNGKYKKVKVGDRLDGGRVAAIGESELRYTKSGRNVTLKMPRS